MKRRPGHPPCESLDDAEALRKLWELRAKMAAEVRAAQGRLEGVDLAIKIFSEANK